MGDILIDGQAALLREKNRNLRRMHVVGIGNEEMCRRLSARHDGQQGQRQQGHVNKMRRHSPL